MRSSKAKKLRKLAKQFGRDMPEAYYELKQQSLSPERKKLYDEHNAVAKEVRLNRASWRSIYRKLKRNRPIG